MSEILMTKKIREELDLRNLVIIAETIKAHENEKDFDSFQIFKIKENYILNMQETPKRERKIPLKYTNKKDETVWGIKEMDSIIGEYWTILYQREY